MKNLPAPPATADEPICSEEQFCHLLRERVRPVIAVGTLIEGSTEIRARVFGYLAEQAGGLEAFLDEFQARGNQRFAGLTELVASVRGFASIGLTLQRILSRRGAAYPGGHGELGTRFLAASEETLAFAASSLLTLFAGVRRECLDLLGEEPVGTTAVTAQASERMRGARLPHDVDEGSAPDQRLKIVELGAKFLAAQKILERLSTGKHFEDPDEMRRFVNEVSDEEQCRFFETRIANLRSTYDTYVHGTHIESEDPKLLLFRGYVGLKYLILRAMRQLVHFYQRHENDVRHEQTKDRIAGLVDKQHVLDRILNYALYYLHAFMREGAPFAEHLLSTYTDQDRMVCDIPEGVVLHVRPVSLILKIVNHHGTPVTLFIGDAECYAGSVLQMLTAVGANADARQVVFEGDREVLRDLQLLFDNGLGEKGTLPPELSYLGGA